MVTKDHDHGRHTHSYDEEFEETPFRLRDIYTESDVRTTLFISLVLLTGPIIGLTAWYIAVTRDYQTPLVVEGAAIIASAGVYLAGRSIHKRRHPKGK